MRQLSINPVTYDPVEGRVEIAHRMLITLSVSGGESAAASKRAQRLASRGFDAVVAGAMLTPEQLNKTWRWESRPVALLIITPPEFVEELTRFVVWKRSCGYLVQVATTEQTGESAGQIKAWVSTQYHGEAPPEYLLLVGDAPTHVPAFTTEYAPGGSDLGYALMNDGDSLPDLIVGRWPVDNREELVALVDKVLAYERVEDPAGAWRERAAFFGGKGYSQHEMTTHQQVIAAMHADDPDSSAARFFDGTAATTTTETLLDQLDSGLAWCVYSGHGSPNGWTGDPRLEREDVVALAVGDGLAVAQGYACKTNGFNAHDDAFGEAVLTLPGRGFVAYWGASNDTYWDEDDWLERGFFDALLDTEVAGTVNQLEEQHSLGAACYAGLLEVTLQGSPLGQYYWEAYNLNGDPSLDPFTRRPGTMMVSAPAAVERHAPEPIEVWVSSDGAAPVAGALVGVTQGESLVAAGFTDQQGVARLSLAAMVGEDELLVRVTAHNFVPADATIRVQGAVNATLSLDADTYRCDQQVGIELVDETLDTSSPMKVRVSVAGSDRSTLVDLTPDSNDTTRRIGSVQLGKDLAVYDKETLDVVSIVPDHVGPSAWATLDCRPPAIRHLQVSTYGAATAQLLVQTDEPAQVVVTTQPESTATRLLTPATAGELVLTGLSPCTEYDLSFVLEDALGNVGSTQFERLVRTDSAELVFTDDGEGAGGQWTVEAATGGTKQPGWQVSNNTQARFLGRSWHVPNRDVVRDDRLTTGPLPTGAVTTTLEFDHHYRFEGGEVAYDGGVLEVSTDGEEFIDVLDAGGVFLTGGYGAVISDCCGNPLAGRIAWTSTSATLTHSVVDLSSLAGEQVWIRFRAGSDSSQADEGWWLDNIALTTTSPCQAATTPSR